MKIAIDSSNQLRASGMVSGSDSEFDNFYSELLKIFSSRGIKPPLHRSKLSRKNREALKKNIAELVNKSRLRFNIYLHLKPKGVNRREYYLRYLPNSMSQVVENWLVKITTNSHLEIFVDDDYNISEISDGTLVFIKTLMKQICSRVSGVYFEPFKERDVFKATVKNPKGSIINLYGRKSSLRDSKEIQIIDVVTGYVLEDSNIFDKEKVRIKEL